MLRLLLLLTGLSPYLPIQAKLLYYEGFDYHPGEDALKYRGGFAATPDPLSGVDSDIAEGSLRYMDAAGNVLMTSGHRAVVDTHEERGTVSNIAPVLRPPGPQPSGNVIWISLLGRQTAGDTTRFFNLGLRAPDDTIQPPDADTNMDEILAIGMPSGAASRHWRVWDRSTNAFLWNSAVSTTPSTDLSLLLLRMELNAVDAVKERYTLWVNPPLDGSPAEAAGFSFVSGDSDIHSWQDLEQIRLAAGHHATSPSGWEVDEIRIADTWQEALPCWPLRIDGIQAGTAPGRWKITWRAAPGFQDMLESSTDLTDWQPLPSSLRINGPVAADAEFETPSPSGAAAPPRFFRLVRRY